MKTVPTAKEFLEFRTPRGISNDYKEYWEAMIEFAHLHVKSALKAASENVNTQKECGKGSNVDCMAVFCRNCSDIISKNSILNAYPETLIK